jgi:hypothetical protein
MTRQDKILAAGLQWSFIHDELKILTSNAFRISQRSDYEHALRSELTRLTRLRQELIDRDVAQSLANGMLRERQLQIQADCVALRAIIQEERQAVDDHEAARRLGGVAAADASTGRARRLINEAINAITQLTSSVTVGVPTRPAQVNTPNSTPGLSDRQGDTSQLFSDNRANPMVRLPTSSLVNAAAIPNAPRGMAASPSNIEVCSLCVY